MNASPAKLVRRFYREFVLRHWRKLLLAFLLTTTVNQAPYAFSMLGKWLVDDILQVGRAAVASGAENPLDEKFAGLWLFLALSLGLRVVTAAFGGFSGYLTSSTGQRVLFRLRTAVQEKLSRLPMSYFDRYSTGQLMVRVMEDANGAQANTVNLPVNVATQFVTLGVGIYLIWAINPTIMLLVLAVLPFYALGSWLFMGALRTNTEAIRNANAELQALLEEKLTNVATIKYYAQEGNEGDRFWGRLTHNLALSWKQNRLNTSLSVVLMIISGLGATGVLMYGFWAFRDGTMKLGEVLAVYQMAALLFGPITTLTNTTVVVQTTGVILARIYDVLDLESDLIDAPGAYDGPVEGTIRFENVTKRYGEGGPVAVAGLDFEVPAGSTLAVLGPSGCGKSTIVNLLLRFYEPDSGSITVDGRDVREMALERLRSAAVLAGQDARIFSGTVAENIAFGDPDVARERVEMAARIVGIHEDILALPSGYETRVGRGGENLPLELIQRIGVARTLVGDPSVLIFDDSVSAVSEQEEEDLYASIERAFERQTVIIITNRVRTAENADRILVMREGDAVEFGTDAELKAMKGVYWRMFLHQTERPEPVAAEVRVHTPEEIVDGDAD